MALRIPTWTQTYTGKALDLVDPQPEDICIEDIAHGLANTCRFTGQCLGNSNVAQHSVLVSEFVLAVPRKTLDTEAWRKLGLVALLHDASEAFLGDVSTQLKQLLPYYLELEERMMRVIFTKFGLDYEMLHDPRIKSADLTGLATEKRDNMAPEPKPWIPLPTPSPVKLELWDHKLAEVKFLSQFYRLGGIA